MAQKQMTERQRRFAEAYWALKDARQAAEQLGAAPVSNPIRGGTDGARLSFMGLPCPNLCTGGYAFHGRFEHIAVEDMDACVRMLVALVARYSR